jgi:hypothetical protein
MAVVRAVARFSGTTGTNGHHRHLLHATLLFFFRTLCHLTWFSLNDARAHYTLSTLWILIWLCICNNISAVVRQITQVAWSLCTARMLAVECAEWSSAPRSARLPLVLGTERLLLTHSLAHCSTRTASICALERALCASAFYECECDWKSLFRAEMLG